MGKLKRRLVAVVALVVFLCAAPVVAKEQKDLPDVQYYGYKIVHHMAAVVDHIEKFGFNTFDHPRIADYRSFVITPALDHFYSKAVADVRFGPVIIDREHYRFVNDIDQIFVKKVVKN